MNLRDLRLLVLLLSLPVLVWACSARDGGSVSAGTLPSAGERSTDPGEAGDAGDNALPPAADVYLGRQIAQTMHWRGADWLLRETREDEENAAQMLDALGLEVGDVVCDLGCGNGYHTLRIAERVGPGGKVYAVDVQPQMLSMLRRRAEKAGLENIERIVGTIADPRLPPDSCDLILMVDVYHELSYPELILSAIRRALKPDGRVALVEFRAEDPEVPIKPLHKMSKAQIRLEWEANGFEVVGEFDELPWQHLVFLGRDDR